MQTVEPLNTGPLQQFIQLTKSAEQSRAKEVKLSLEQAKNLSYALGIVMSRLHGDLEKLVKDYKNDNNDVIEVRFDGGTNF